MSYENLFNELSAVEAPKSSAEKYIFAGFSPEQAAALASSISQSAVISAGAGAGKTKILVERAADLVMAGADPSSIAVVTFTRKAAEEIQARLKVRLKGKATPVCSTVHALALSALVREGGNFELIEDAMLEALLDSLRSELPEDYQDLTNNELNLKIGRLREETGGTALDQMMVARFLELLSETGTADFTSLLSESLATKKLKFKYLLIDEAQDLSRLQLRVLQHFGRDRSVFWFIGDADQSIYAFRGAHGGVMQELIDEYKNHYVLSQNYRSCQHIVKHANNVIRNNSDRIDIEWIAVNPAAGLVGIRAFETADEEQSEVLAWQKGKKSYVVLARTQALVESYKALGINAATVHESKGLEWEHVWVAGCEACSFPHPLAPREEERRLFYFAMTRAKLSLTMSYAAKRSYRKEAAVRAPSPFLFETQALNA